MKEFSDVVEACRFLLVNDFPGTEDAKTYLDKRLTKEAQEKFEFGYFPTEENISILTSMVGEDKLLKCKLLYERFINDFSSDPWDYLDDSDLENSGAQQNEYKFKSSKIIKSTKAVSRVTVPILKDHNLVMPYKDAYGNVIAMVGRTLLEDYQNHSISKYKNTSFEKGNHLFGLNLAKDSIRKNDYVYIVEGQFDCIKAHERGIHNIVALGSSNMTLYQISLILRYTKNIYLLLDNDDAGEKGRDQIIKKFSKYADFVKLYVPSEFKDLDEYLTNYNGAPSFITKLPNF